MQTISGQWARFIRGLDIDAVPTDVIEKTALRILDCLGTGLAARGLKVPDVALAFIGTSSGPATVVGHPRRVTPLDAALVNATLLNGRSEDDFLQKSHPGALTIPSALAVAEETRRSGADVLMGVLAGYEIVGRVYLGGPAMLPRFRASGVAGTVGAAASAARLYGLDVDGIVNALGCAAMLAHGFGEGFLSGTTEVKLNVGFASRNGLSAALLAKAGATASPLAFEGEAGFYRAFAGSLDQIDQATQDLGKRFLIEDTVYKECPVCIFTQTPIALARRLAAEVDPRKIEKVRVTAPELTYTNPGFTNVAPFRTHLQAVVSARFCVAAALLGRPVESHALYDELDDPEVLALAEKVELQLRPEDRERIDLEVMQSDGVRRAGGIEHDTLLPTEDKILAKFRRLTAGLPVDTEAVIATVLALEDVDDIRVLTDLLRAEH
jgi:2-methylcitrate dehydratase PrpD